MTRFDTAKTVLGSRGAGDDRVDVVHRDKGTLIVVADGVGGMGGGSEAAEAAVTKVCGAADGLISGEIDPSDLLSKLDHQILPTGGQTAAVIVVVRPDGLFGASVGDSGALVCMGGQADDLTHGQRRKPLIGSGSAEPVGFRRSSLDGTLLVATDGLLKYAKWTQLVETLDHPNLEGLPDLLVSLVRLRSGELQDDVGIVVCRMGAQA